MPRALIGPVFAAFLSVATASGQLPPGYLDPEPILRAAERAIGADKLKCVKLSGTGYAGIVGQQRESGWNIDWPRAAALSNYTRTIDWERQTSKEEFERPPGQNPASWKYGSGWKDGTRVQQNARQTFVVNGKHAWHIDGPNSKPVAAPPDDAERWQLDLWMNPHGFLKAARLPGANPRAAWRWELGESGRDGHTTKPEKVRIVSIAVLGKYRVDATINKENMLQRIHTWVPDPVLGDMNYEHEFTNETYVDLGNGIKLPTLWHHHDGWDDNYGTLNVSAGHNGFGGEFKNVVANSCEPVAVPAEVREATFPVRVESRKLAEGVYLLGGSSHNSVAVEFKDYIAVVEAPLNEQRSLAVIEEVVKLIPSKPIRFLVNTHQHFDHIGGIRTYMHIGATIITHFKNFEFYNRDVLNYVARKVEPDMMSLWPPTEVAEGYNYEVVRENYTLSDGVRTMHMSYVQPLPHSEGMLLAYLPNEKMVIEADLFDTHESAQKPDKTNRLYFHVQRLGLQVDTIVPIHGQPVTWSSFVQQLGAN